MSMYENLDMDRLDGVKGDVEDHSSLIDNVVSTILDPYCKDLDRYVSFIKECLKDGCEPPTSAELEDYCLNLSTYIYFAGGMSERLGVREDISKEVWKEIYNTERSKMEKGTVADKDAMASLMSQHEKLTYICYSRAYKTMKAKVENAQELLSSCKKVLSHRMQEMELTRIGG